MALKTPQSNIHWNYFLALEEDFGVTTRYIEPCKENERTFSIELSRLIMASAQETDVLFKCLCENISPGCDASSVGEYYKIFKNHLPQLFEVEVHLERYPISAVPFLSWSDNASPEWWTANNKIKHHRSTEFRKANMENAIKALSALLVLNIYYFKSEMQKINNRKIEWFKVTEYLAPESKYFYLDQKYYLKNVKSGAIDW